MNKLLSIIFIFLSCLHSNFLSTSEPKRPTTPLKPDHLINPNIFSTAFDIADEDALNHFLNERTLYAQKMLEYKQEMKVYHNYLRSVATARLIKKHHLPTDSIKEILQYL
ncbi:hypothetical protein KBB68_01770 [Candidatus Babeliales bacterium]|nr:hypothetical protein [Candidatus Babeliales bacterium]